jgi:hypothetical protein
LLDGLAIVAVVLALVEAVCEIFQGCNKVEGRSDGVNVALVFTIKRCSWYEAMLSRKGTGSVISI